MKSPPSSLVCLTWLLTCLPTTRAAGEYLFGVAYTPYRTFGACPTDGEIYHDLSVVTRHSNRIRTYTTECDNMNHILLQQASTGAISLMLGIWLDNRSTDQIEIDTMMSLLREYPYAKLHGLVVGNEAILRGTISPSRMAERIYEVRDKVRAIGYETGSAELQNVPIMTMETNVFPEIVTASDKIGINIQPFYHTDLHLSGDSDAMAEQGAERAIVTYDVMKALSSGKEVVIGEVGWPSKKRDFDPMPASIDVEKRFLQKFISKADSRGIEYFWFELFDSNWKIGNFGDYNEPNLHFGMYFGDRSTPKW